MADPVVLVASGPEIGAGFHPLYGSPDNTGVEARAQRTLRTAGTFSKLAFKTDDTGVSFICEWRTNGADATMQADATNLTAGVWEDAVNTETPSVGDEINLETSGVSGEASWTRVLFTAASGRATLFSSGGQASGSGPGETGYRALGTTQITDTENNAEFLLRAGGAHKHLFVFVITNTINGNSVVRSRLNGADGNLIVTFPTSTTGILEDTSNSDTVAAGDTVDYSFVVAGSSGSINFGQSASTIEWSGTQDDGVAGLSNDWDASATPRYFYLLGWNHALVTVEDEKEVRPGFDITTSRMRCYVTGSNTGAATTVRLRENGANGNQTFSITASTTGLFEDTTNTDVIQAASDFNGSIVGGTSGAMTIAWFGITMGVAAAAAAGRIWRLVGVGGGLVGHKIGLVG